MKSLYLLVCLSFTTSFFVFSQGKPENYQQNIVGTKVQFQMVGVPSGIFWMGNKKGKADEQPRHKVQLDAFWMSSHEVTWDLYELFVYKDYELSSNQGQLPANVDAITRPTKPYLDMTFGMGKENYPALAMTHYNAIQFCKWLYARTGVFYRLPTEAEWEYASRAGTETNYFFGDSADQLSDYAWFKGNTKGKTQEVGKKKPNPWGFYDIYGNVAEWTYDQYDPEFYATSSKNGLAINPVAKPEKLYAHVIRGGSYDETAQQINSSLRMPSSPSWKQIDPQIPKSNWWFPEAPFIGIRLVRPSKEPSKAEIDAYYNQAPIADY